MLLKWKGESTGSSAILINGARLVGKSFLAEEFGKREYRDYTTINFTKLEPAVKAVFDGYDGNIDNFLQALSVAIGRVLPVRESLVIFDEVQLCPKARQMIKFLVEDGRYDYIESGSLLSIKTNIKEMVIPSEEENLNLYSLDSEEFLWAMGNETAIPHLRRCLADTSPVEVKSSDHLNHSSLDRFIDRFGKTAGQAYLLCTKDVRWSGDVLYLPLYMAVIL